MHLRVMAQLLQIRDKAKPVARKGGIIRDYTATQNDLSALRGDSES